MRLKSLTLILTSFLFSTVPSNVCKPEQSIANKTITYKIDKDWLRKQVLIYLKNKPIEPEYEAKHIHKVNAKNFEQNVLKNKLPVMLEFGAEWCGWCKKVKPNFDEVCGKHEKDLYCAEIEDSREIFKKYNIQSLPTFGFFNNGKAVKKFWFEGYQRKKIIEDLVERFLEYIK